MVDSLATALQLGGILLLLWTENLTVSKAFLTIGLRLVPLPDGG